MNILPNLPIPTPTAAASTNGTPAPAGKNLFDALILALVGPAEPAAINPNVANPAAPASATMTAPAPAFSSATVPTPAPMTALAPAPDLALALASANMTAPAPEAPKPAPAPMSAPGVPKPFVGKFPPRDELPENAYLYAYTGPEAVPPPLPPLPAPAPSFGEPVPQLQTPVLDPAPAFTAPARNFTGPVALPVPETASTEAESLPETTDFPAPEMTSLVPLVKNRNKPMSAPPAEISFLPEGTPIAAARPEFGRSLLRPLQTEPSELPTLAPKSIATPIATTVSTMNAQVTPKQQLQPAATVRRDTGTSVELNIDRPKTLAPADSTGLFARAAEPELRTTPAQNVDAPQPVSRPAEVFADAAIKMHREGNQRVEITLDLGEGKSLSITLDRRGDSIRPTFHADAPEVRQALENGWNRVSDRLSDHGIRLERPTFDSSANRDDQSDRSRQQQGREPREESHPNHQRPRREPTQPIPVRANAPATKSGLHAFA